MSDGAGGPVPARGRPGTAPDRTESDRLRTLPSVTIAAQQDPSGSPLVARTTEVADPGPLLALLPETDPLAWVRHGDGLVGWGVAASCRPTGPDRFAVAEQWWDDIVADSVVRDEMGVPGSGLVAFGSFAFADDPGESWLVVPRVVVGRRHEGARVRTWVTVVGAGQLPAAEEPVPAPPAAAPQGLRYADGALSGARWAAAVEDAVRRIGEGKLEKVVLARDLLAQADAPIDARWPLRRLADAYPGCWTYCVDGLVGATPELLVRRERGLVTSRVLAGTIRRSGDDQHDLALAGALARSSKDLEEHEYAVRSVAEALAPHCSSMFVPESPFVLHLPNVMHLATDVTGVLDDRSGALGLAAALHPSAAVGGTPTALALAAITDLEQMPRGRYAGPVGWIDAAGDGEWGLALRCGQLDGARVRLFAGCGIVAGSESDAELAEAQAKLVPMRDALGG
ncbi:MAG: isochorismate synthase [Nocardioidaceae bacterium]|nr:isochorismate synthase [Nocardioidaceae bacterium]